MKNPRMLVLAGVLAGLSSAPALAGRITIVSEADSAKLWSPAPGAAQVHAGYPTTVGKPAQDVCVNIGYLIGADGSTSNFTQMKAWTSVAGDEPTPDDVQPFVQSAAAAVSMWRLAPKTAKARSVYTSATFVFDGSKAQPREAIGAHCRIDDLEAHVAKATRDKERRGDLGRTQQDAQERNREMMARQQY